MSANATSLSHGSIREAAKALVKRFGEAKTNMVDIGRALGVSHAALYRFYPSRSAVMDAIVQEAMDDEEIMASRFLQTEGAAGERLQAMVLELHRRKRERFVGDREVHDLYRRILIERRDMIVAYAETMTRLIARLIDQAVERGEWKVDDVARAAGVVRDAVTIYVHPLFVAQAVEGDVPAEALLTATLATLIRAFEAGVTYHDQSDEAPSPYIDDAAPTEG